ncbi:MAG: RibD family protein, partial [Pseudomonadota bacterium]
TVRDLGPLPQPARVVLSRRLDIPLDGQLAQSARDVPVILLHGPNPPEETRMAWEKAGAQLQEVPIGAGRQLDPEAALRALGAMGLNRVFCEGGGHLAAALLSHDLVDELAVFQAGLMIGAEGLPSLGAMGLAHLSEASRFELSDCRSIGPDSLSLWSRRELG